MKPRNITVSLATQSLERDDVWTGNDGRTRSITELDAEHLVNLILFIERNASTFKANELKREGMAKRRRKEVARMKASRYVATSPFMVALRKRLGEVGP